VQCRSESTTAKFWHRWRDIRLIDLVSAKRKTKVSWLISFHSLIRQCLNILIRHCNPFTHQKHQNRTIKTTISQQYTFFVFPFTETRSVDVTSVDRSRRLCWSDAHWHGASLITSASDNGNVVCSVSWIRMANTLNTHFTNCLYCKITVVRDVVVLKYFLEYSTTFFANYQPESDV